MAAIKNIIFDLGAVLLNIDFNKATAAFEQLGASRFEELYSQNNADKLFEELETGKISEAIFYQKMQHYCRPGTTYQQIEAAWNEILLDFRLPSLAHMEVLKERYSLFLLSNTNSIHKKSFDKTLQQVTGKNSLDAYFTKSYYSHIMQRRKPYVATYKFVLQDGQIDTMETLFIDDSVANIEGAREAGLHTHLLLSEERVEWLGL
jgi:glucose-1-phosphatase